MQQKTNHIDNQLSRRRFVSTSVKGSKEVVVVNYP